MDRDFDEELARALASDAELPESLLERLSGLEGLALRRFHDVWEQLPAERRVSLLAQLGEMGEANLVLDFQPIYIDALADRDGAVREEAYRLAAPEADPDLLEAYIRAALTDPDDDVRLSAVEALSHFALVAQADDWPDQQQRQIETALLGILKLPNADLAMRRAALLSVAFLTTDAVAEEIRRFAAEPAMRDAAIESMGRNAQPIWIPHLAEALQDEDPGIREVAADAAGEIEDEAFVPYLIPRLEDEDEEVRMAAIEALGLIGGREAKAALTQLLVSDDPQLREGARDALEALLASENPLSS
jgi:HEAT repeat protein